MTVRKPEKSHGWRGSADLWLDAAYERLISGGIEAVKILPLAKDLGLSRTSFYWHFADRDALLSGIVDRWQAQNTGNLLARCAAPADTICAALFNLFDCWIDPGLFDAKLDLAIRNWARNDSQLQAQVETADSARITAISDMFQRFGFSETQARTRAHTVIFTQVGYYTMALGETKPERLRAMPPYVEVYAGISPTPSEIAAFFARHGLVDEAAGLA